MINRLRKSIVAKMFAVNFISMMGIVAIIFIIQSIYLEQFYINNKISNIVENVNDFADKLENNKLGYDELSKEVNEFSYNNNANISIENLQSLKGLYDGSNKEYIIYVRIKEKYYNLYITEMQLKDAFDGNIPKIDESFNIYAVETDDYVLQPIEINGTILSYETLKEVKDNRFLKGEAYILKISMISEDILDIDSDNEMIEDDFYTSEFKENLTELDGVKYRIEKFPDSEYSELTLYRDIRYKKSELSIYVTASLQPVKEVLNVLKKYYSIFFVLCGVISLFVAWLYSKLVSKPVLKLNQTAKKIADMDFGVTIEEDRIDELGDLSKSINSLSVNLDEALNNLKKANEDLKFDIEKEKKQELIRKEFVANVSHELKTPLGIIKGYSEGIKDGVKKEKKDHYIDVILEEVDRMNNLIMSMLELSKIEHKKLDRIDQIDIKEMILKTRKSLDVNLKNKEIKFEMKGEYTSVLGVENNIRQVTINLMTNAIKHCESGGRVIVRAEVLKGKNFIYIYNDGKHIDEQDFQNIWLRFYKGDKSHNRGVGGTGLGLAIVKAILEKHQSEFGVRNVEKGVEFYFSLPINDEKSLR